MIILSQPLFHKAIAKDDIGISQSGFVKTDEGWHQRPMYAAYSRLYFVTEGHGMLISDDMQMQLEAGYVYLAPCGMRCGFYGTPSVTKLYFHVNLALGEQGTDPFSQVSHFARLPMPVSEINELREQYFSTDPLDHFLLKGAITQTVSQFIRANPPDTPSDRGARSVTVSDAIRYICSHLNARLTVGEISEAVFCSQSKLSMLFRTERGQTVASYVDDLLMSEAQNQLLYTTKSIGKISEELGFCDQFYFSRIFKKRFGVSPAGYRKLKKQL